MAGLWADNFGWYNVGQLSRLYSTVVQNGTITIGPFGIGTGPALRFFGDKDDEIEATPPTAPSGAVVGIELDRKLDSYPSTTTPLLLIYDGTTIQGSLDVTSTGVLEYYRGSGGGKTLLVGSGSYVVPLGVHFYLGLEVTINNSTGTVLVQVREPGDTVPQIVINSSGLDTQESGAAQWTKYRVRAGTTGASVISNLRANDGSGSEYMTLFGPATVHALRPKATGALAEFFRSSGVHQFAMVDDIVTDDDLSYNYALATNKTDTFDVNDQPQPDQELGWTMLVLVAKNAGTGTVQLAHIAREGTTNTAGSSFNVTSSYVAYPKLYQKTPAGVSWAGGNPGAAILNAMEWGYRAPV